MLVVLTIISAIVVVIFFAVVIWYLVQISQVLEAIGGRPDSFLAKLSFGLRAIQQETGHLPGEVTRLNESLTQVADGLKQVDGRLAGTIEAVGRQKGATN